MAVEETRNIAEMLCSVLSGEALKSKSSLPRKVIPSALIRPLRLLPHPVFERKAAVSVQAANVSIHAGVARSSSQPLLDTSQ